FAAGAGEAPPPPAPPGRAGAEGRPRPPKASMSPGVMVSPFASLTRASGGAATPAPTASIRPSRTTTVASSYTGPETVTTRPPTIAKTSRRAPDATVASAAARAATVDILLIRTLLGRPAVRCGLGGRADTRRRRGRHRLPSSGRPETRRRDRAGPACTGVLRRWTAAP